MTIPSTFTVVKFARRQLPSLRAELQTTEGKLGILRRVSRQLKLQGMARRCPFLPKRGGDAHKGRQKEKKQHARTSERGCAWHLKCICALSDAHSA